MQGISLENYVDNQQPTGNPSQSDPHPVIEFSTCWFNNPIDSHPGETCYTLTRIQEEIPCYCFGTFWGKQNERIPKVIDNSAVRTILRQLKHILFCWPFNSWRATATPLILTITSTRFLSCMILSLQHWPPSTGNPKTFNCLKICSKQISKITNSWHKKTK